MHAYASLQNRVKLRHVKNGTALSIYGTHKLGSQLDMATNTDEKDLSKVANLQAYLEDTPFAAEKIDALSGGNVNFTFRIRLKTPYDGRSTMIVKHGKPYVALSEGRIPFSLERQVRIFVTEPHRYLYSTCRDSKLQPSDMSTC